MNDWTVVFEQRATMPTTDAGVQPLPPPIYSVMNNMTKVWALRFEESLRQQGMRAYAISCHTLFEYCVERSGPAFPPCDTLDHFELAPTAPEVQAMVDNLAHNQSEGQL